MTNNANLKRAARSFMEKHAVDYSTALRAVDEPLHELRDLIDGPRSLRFARAPLFRLRPEENLYGDPLATERELRGEDWNPLKSRFFFQNTIELMEESVRRVHLLRAAGAFDIWEYRELSRAGVLSTGSPELEPIFHHYYGSLESDLGAIASFGSKVGIFGASLSPLLRISDELSHIPVTEEQLRALGNGNPVGAIEGFRFSLRERSGDAERWTDSYRSMVVSYARTNHNEPRLTIFSKKTGEQLDEELLSQGVPREQCEVFEFVERDRELNFSLWSTRIEVLRGSERIAYGDTDRIVLWETEPLPEPPKPTILEVAESIGAKFEREADGTLTRDDENKISTACPFHEENGDRFIIYPEREPRGFFSCYGCGRNGGPERLQLEWDNPHIWDERPTRPSAAS